MADEKRVVLVKTGDVLLISGVTLPTDEGDFDASDAVARFFREHCGISVALFEDDITIGVAAADQVTLCTTCGSCADAPGCVPTPSGPGHTWSAGCEASGA